MSTDSRWAPEVHFPDQGGGVNLHEILFLAGKGPLLTTECTAGVHSSASLASIVVACLFNTGVNTMGWEEPSPLL